MKTSMILVLCIASTALAQPNSQGNMPNQVPAPSSTTTNPTITSGPTTSSARTDPSSTANSSPNTVAGLQANPLGGIHISVGEKKDVTVAPSQSLKLRARIGGSNVTVHQPSGGTATSQWDGDDFEAEAENGYQAEALRFVNSRSQASMAARTIRINQDIDKLVGSHFTDVVTTVQKTVYVDKPVIVDRPVPVDRPIPVPTPVPVPVNGYCWPRHYYWPH